MSIKPNRKKKTDDEIKKSILKIISNKINRNRKKGDLIWHIKKIKGGWNWKNNLILLKKQTKTNHEV